MTAKKTAKRKPRKLTKATANQAIADINYLLKRRKKLDVELKNLRRHIKKMLGHHYFS